MKENPHTELYEALLHLRPENLSKTDMQDLLSIFNGTENHALRHRIVLIFAETCYNAAIPFIIKKINEKELYNANGTLVYALESLDSLDYFIDVVKILCVMAYEARLMAYHVIEKFAESISEHTRRQSLEILESYRSKMEHVQDDKYENSALHFINATERLLVNLNLKS